MAGGGGSIWEAESQGELCSFGASQSYTGRSRGVRGLVVGENQSKSKDGLKLMVT